MNAGEDLATYLSSPLYTIVILLFPKVSSDMLTVVVPETVSVNGISSKPTYTVKLPVASSGNSTVIGTISPTLTSSGIFGSKR